MVFVSKISNEELADMPTAVYEGPVTVVDGPGAEYDEAIAYLSAQKVIGFDTETKPCFVAGAPRNKTALLQLAGRDRAFLFRLKKMGLPEDLAGILASNKIFKVGAAVRDDIKGLQRYRRFEAKSFVDLQNMVSSFGILEKSVRKMAAIVLGTKVSKGQQLSNWEAEHLSPGQIQYAALDAWICRQIYESLQHEVPQVKIV